jgi:hypothetical protein
VLNGSQSVDEWNVFAGEKGVGRVPIPTRGIHCGTLYMYYFVLDILFPSF